MLRELWGGGSIKRMIDDSRIYTDGAGGTP
jgi:hypothetical protein